MNEVPLKLFEKSLSAVIKLHVLIIPARMTSIYFRYVDKSMASTFSVDILVSMSVMTFVCAVGLLYFLSLGKRMARQLYIILFYISLPAYSLSIANFDFESLGGSIFRLIVAIIQIALQSWCVYVLLKDPVRSHFAKNT